MKNVLPKSFLDRSRENYELKKRLFSGCKNLTIVPCSDWMADFVRESFLKDKRIAVIKNGVDLNVFRPLVRKGDKGRLSILAVSSIWNKEKGLYDIYRLRELIPREYAITIVGLTAKQIRQLPVGIKGIERTQNVNELVRLYSDADVFINPTYADTFPTVNLEALACGTPVLTYRTGGSPEAVTEETGWVVEQGDVEGMATIVNSLEKRVKSVDDEKRKACRLRAEQEFDKEKCLKSI